MTVSPEGRKAQDLDAGRALHTLKSNDRVDPEWKSGAEVHALSDKRAHVRS